MYKCCNFYFLYKCCNFGADLVQIFSFIKCCIIHWFILFVSLIKMKQRITSLFQLHCVKVKFVYCEMPYVSSLNIAYIYKVICTHPHLSHTGTDIQTCPCMHNTHADPLCQHTCMCMHAHTHTHTHTQAPTSTDTYMHNTHMPDPFMLTHMDWHT